MNTRKRGVPANPGPWRQHWSVLIVSLVTSLLMVALVWMVTFFIHRSVPMLATIFGFLLGFMPAVVAYLRWRQYCIFVSDWDIIFTRGVINRQAVSFPIRDIDATKVRQSLFGRILNFADVAIFSGPNMQTFEKLHPFKSFAQAYRAYNQRLSGWNVPPQRYALPSPPTRVFGPPLSRASGQATRSPVIRDQYRQFNHFASGAGGEPFNWFGFLALLMLTFIISTVIALLILNL